MVLDRDDEHQRPEYKGHHSQHVVLRGWNAVLSIKRLADRVQRARPDVPVHDAEGRDRHHGEVAAARLAAGTVLHRLGHRG